VTQNQFINLLKENKPVLVYLALDKQFFVVNDFMSLKGVLNKCSKVAVASFEKLLEAAECANSSQTNLNFARAP